MVNRPPTILPLYYNDRNKKPRKIMNETYPRHLAVFSDYPRCSSTLTNCDLFLNRWAVDSQMISLSGIQCPLTKPKVI